MVAFLIAIVLLTAACGFLWHRAAALGQELRAVRLESAAGASLETEKFAILQEAVEVLRQKNLRLQGRLDESQQELASLGYSISHDLRAPLRSINGFSQALAEDYGPRLDGTAQDYLRRVRAGAVHMNALIDELLALSRIGRTPLHPVALDLSALAWEVARVLSAGEPTRRVEWNIDPGLTAWGDRTLLALALHHLLGNAWKFSAGRAIAHVTFRAIPGAAVPSYEVRDDGAGFDMQYAGRLFGIFQRMHAADEFAGHGTGLAVTQRIIRRHGGDIRASAAPGEGATFTFTLGGIPASGGGPLLPSLAEAEAVSVEAHPPAQPKATAV